MNYKKTTTNYNKSPGLPTPAPSGQVTDAVALRTPPVGGVLVWSLAVRAVSERS